MRAIDKFLANRITKIVSNSKNVCKRVKECYGIESGFVYSACIKKFSKTRFGNFYFYPGRIDKPKGIEIAIRAFRNMPNKKLIIAGSAVNKNYLNFLYGIKPKNVEILTNVKENKMNELYRRCLATICLAENEDFGFIPVESMSFGKPCIAANEGGFLETVVNLKNGLLVNRNEHDLTEAIIKFEDNFKNMGNSCIETAKKFTMKNYIAGMKRVFESTTKQI